MDERSRRALTMTPSSSAAARTVDITHHHGVGHAWDPAHAAPLRDSRTMTSPWHRFEVAVPYGSATEDLAAG